MVYSSQYKKRKKIYERDNYSCHYCGLKATDILDDGLQISIKVDDPEQVFPFVLDHKTPRFLGGGSKYDNLVTCCWRCNLLKGSTPYKIFMQAYGTT